MLHVRVVLLDLALTLCLVAVGVGGAWLMRRRSTLSIRNVYPPAFAVAAAMVVCVVVRAWGMLIVLLPLAAPFIAAAAVGRRWRLVDLGAGEELRNHELSRRWLWQPAPERAPGERQYLRSQGELVHERPWPTERRVRVDERSRRRGSEVAARRRPARRAVRRDGRR